MPAEQRASTFTTRTGRAEDQATARKGYQRQDKVRSLQRALYRSAKIDRRRVFHQLFDHVYRQDVLWEAWKQVRRNGGAGGSDDVEIETFEQNAAEEIERLGTELRSGQYRPSPIRRALIPKSRTEMRPLGIPCIRDRVVQTAVKIVLEPIFEARFYEHSYGFRPRRSAHEALDRAGRLINSGYRHVLDVDVRQFFDSVPHGKLMGMMRWHVSDRRMLRMVKAIVTAPIKEPSGVLRRPRKGCPQGGPLSPLLANAYLTILDHWFLKHTRYREVVLLRYADDLLVVSRGPTNRLRQQLAYVLGRMGLELHAEKTREVDMATLGASFDFLGYRFARRRARRTNGLCLLRYPSPKAMRSFRARITELVPSRGSMRLEYAVREVNAVIRGWVRYFSRSNRRGPFRALSDFVKARMRALIVRRTKRRGRGTRRYPDQWLIRRLGLLNAYHLYVSLQSNAVGGK
jgi:RNA-directed DNA polymerase